MDRLNPPGWSAAERAEHLGRLRPQLLASLPVRVTGARDLAVHRREEVIDDAILYTAFDHATEVASAEVLERVFWAAVTLRVGSALRGRSDTVRGSFRAVELDASSDLASAGDDPAAIAETRFEWETLLEFARRLEPLERAVILKRHQRQGAEKVYGYATIAAELGQPERAVRTALRNVQRKLDAFSMVVADRQALERKLPELLPVPVLAERAVRPSGWRETLIDWVGRPFGHDATTAASTLAASGGGRGLGTLAAAICLGGTAAGGTYCAITGDLPLTGPGKAQAARDVPRRAAEATTGTAAPVRRDTQLQTNEVAQAARERAAVQERRRRDRRVARRRSVAQSRAEERRAVAASTRRSESAGAITPAAPNAAANGSSEFDPTFQPSAPPQPAAPADPGGAPEFP